MATGVVVARVTAVSSTSTVNCPATGTEPVFSASSYVRVSVAPFTVAPPVAASAGGAVSPASVTVTTTSSMDTS